MRRTDEGHRKVHRCRNPTPFSTGGYGCGMKRLSLIRNFLVSQKALHFCALPPNSSLPSALSTTLFEVLFRRSQSVGARSHVWRAAAQSPRTPTPLFPTIEFA
jgi:hypothetical protein